MNILKKWWFWVLIIIIISGFLFIQRFESVGSVGEGRVCEIDEDCSYLDCTEEQERIGDSISIRPICEYNKCVCGCGDPENGALCD